MIRNNRISILGCGWAGYPLAKLLVNKGYSVKGSVRSADKLPLMLQDGIDPFLVQFNPDFVADREGFFDSDVLIVTIPPRDPDLYLRQIGVIISKIKLHGIKKIVYFSSTSVYANTYKIVDENDLADPETASGKAIFSAENLFLNNASFRTTIIRFSGLVGPGRHPGRFLAGKTNIPNGLAPVNLIHLTDCIGIVSAVLENNFFGKIVNACCPDHPTRKDFYTLAARMAGLTEPQFIGEFKEGKLINSIVIPELLNYDFRIKNWVNWLRSSDQNL